MHDPKALVEELLFENVAGLVPICVEKIMTLTISDWEQYPLPRAQIALRYTPIDAIVSLWPHESSELRVGAAAAKAVVVQDAAAKGVAVHDTAAKAVAVQDFAMKDTAEGTLMVACMEDNGF